MIGNENIFYGNYIINLHAACAHKRTRTRYANYHFTIIKSDLFINILKPRSYIHVYSLYNAIQ